MFIIIAAIGQNRELGYRGDLCFRLKDDLRFFRQTTAGHPVVMGRKTWASLPQKLPQRSNLVVSRHPDRVAPKGAARPDQIISDLDAFLAAHESTPEKIFIIGGGQLYRRFLPHAQTLYLTEIAASAPADTFFPPFDPTLYTQTLIKKGSENGVNFTISQYDKR